MCQAVKEYRFHWFAVRIVLTKKKKKIYAGLKICSLHLDGERRYCYVELTFQVPVLTQHLPNQPLWCFCYGAWQVIIFLRSAFRPGGNVCNHSMHVVLVWSFREPFKNLKKTHRFFSGNEVLFHSETAWTPEMVIVALQTGRNPKPEPGHWQRSGPC